MTISNDATAAVLRANQAAEQHADAVKAYNEAVSAYNEAVSAYNCALDHVRATLAAAKETGRVASAALDAELAKCEHKVDKP